MEQHQTKVSSQKNWYDKSYKVLLFIPVALLVLSFIYLFMFYQDNGDFIRKDVSLTGGTSISLFDENIDKEQIIDALEQKFPDIGVRTISDIITGKQIGLVIETKAEVEPVKVALQEAIGYELNEDNSSIEFSGSSLSSGFYKQLRFALVLAFVLMAIVVFIIFRSFAPSIAVVFAAFSDIVMTIATVNLMGMDLSAAGIVALLMLIGYSVDTDILLTTRMLKGEESSLNARIFGALKTGMTMTLAAIAAVVVSLLITYNVSEVLKQTFEIILIGLIFDIMNTWLTNASILKWYMEVKGLR
ncbi:MAG: protein translocase subunit SecF [Nanoarchaeota archaeon]